MLTDGFAGRAPLSQLLRFATSKSGDGLASLEEVASRIKPGQKELYFVATESKESAQNSPFVEKLAKKDLEVTPLPSFYAMSQFDVS
jgi:HSP90 family molecular chaperone